MKVPKTQKSSLLVRFSMLALAAYAAVSLITLQMEIHTRQQQLAEVEQLKMDQLAIQKDLERQLVLGDDESHMARIAREKLDMGFADERVFRDASGS